MYRFGRGAKEETNTSTPSASSTPVSPRARSSSARRSSSPPAPPRRSSARGSEGCPSRRLDRDIASRIGLEAAATAGPAEDVRSPLVDGGLPRRVDGDLHATNGVGLDGRGGRHGPNA